MEEREPRGRRHAERRRRSRRHAARRRRGHAKPPDPAALRAALREPRVRRFFVELLAFGMAIGVVERMLFVYVLGPLRGSSTLCGGVVLVSSLFNVPVFLHAGALLRALGHDGLVLVAQVCYCTRVYGCGARGLAARALALSGGRDHGGGS